MTADQKVAYVEKQVTALEQGKTNVLNCPYCGEQNREGDCPDRCPDCGHGLVVQLADGRWECEALGCEATGTWRNPLCCVPLGRAVAAVIMGKETREKAEHAERIAEKVASN